MFIPSTYPVFSLINGFFIVMTDLTLRIKSLVFHKHVYSFTLRRIICICPDLLFQHYIHNTMQHRGFFLQRWTSYFLYLQGFELAISIRWLRIVITLRPKNLSPKSLIFEQNVYSINDTDLALERSVMQRFPLYR